MTADRTADGELIHIGDVYWDNNLERVIVTGVSHDEDERRFGKKTGRTVRWYRTSGGMADGSRLAKRHPGTGEIA